MELRLNTNVIDLFFLGVSFLINGMSQDEVKNFIDGKNMDYNDLRPVFSKFAYVKKYSGTADSKAIRTIHEEFALSLGNFQSQNKNQFSDMMRSKLKSVVDQAFQESKVPFQDMIPCFKNESACPAAEMKEAKTQILAPLLLNEDIFDDLALGGFLSYFLRRIANYLDAYALNAG